MRRAQYIKHPSTVPIPREQKKYCVYFSRVHYARNERTNASDAGHASERTNATAVTTVTHAHATYAHEFVTQVTRVAHAPRRASERRLDRIAATTTVARRTRAGAIRAAYPSHVRDHVGPNRLRQRTHTFVTTVRGVCGCTYSSVRFATHLHLLGPRDSLRPYLLHLGD